jgi:hypothetical protein
MGRAASSGLGLGDGPVAGAELRAVLAGLQPGTGQLPNGGPAAVFRVGPRGFDLTFAAPKSVSVLYALGDPLVESACVAAHDRAVDVAVSWLERESCRSASGTRTRSATADRRGAPDPHSSGAPRASRGPDIGAEHTAKIPSADVFQPTARAERPGTPTNCRAPRRHNRATHPSMRPTPR